MSGKRSILALLLARLALFHGTMPNTGGIQCNDRIERDEGIAAGAILPGAVLIGSATDGQVAVAGAAARATIGHALENLNADKGYRDAYAAADAVPYNKHKDSAWMGIILASSAALAYNDALKTAASGKLEKWVQGTDAIDLIVAWFDEKADFTPPASDTYHRVRRGGVS